MNDSEDSKHSYSCKRCRRLKKKCTRSIPECQNCLKAGESCEYVPRAPRRKKSEILKSLQEQQQQKQQEQQQQQQQQQQQVQQQNKDESKSTTPVLTNQENYKEIYQDNYPHIPKIPPIPMINNNSTNIAPSLNILDRSPKNFNLGTTDPFSYKTNINSSSSLPPLSSLTNITSNQSNNNIPSFQTNPNYHFSPPQSRHPSDEFPNVNKSPLLPQTQPQTQGLIQNKLLSSILGVEDTIDTTIIRPNIDQAFLIQLVKTFFEENFHSYPFLNRSAILEAVISYGIDRLDALDSKDSFEIYMIFFIGYCSLERIGKISTDIQLKKYLVSKSIQQTSYVITLDDLDSVKYLILLGIYSLYDVQGFMSWHIAGNITRLVLSLGLNRQGFKNRNASHDRSLEELRNRVFWSAYNFDRLISISMGRPFGIDDDDINLPFPTKLMDEDIYDIELIAAIISLRKIEGKILKNIHSVNSASKLTNIHGRDTMSVKNEILQNLRIEVEDWYNLTNSLNGHQKNPIYNVSWFTAHYYQLNMLLYRPSFLIPNPSKETLQVLGKSSLQALAYTYNLHTAHLLQPNWVNIYRFLTQCTTIIYCLCHWCIDLIESKTEINLCIEILDNFGDRWPVAARSAQVFKKINMAIYEIKVSSNWKLQDTNILSDKFFEASSAYHDVLNNNNIDIWFDDPMIANSEK